MSMDPIRLVQNATEQECIEYITHVNKGDVKIQEVGVRAFVDACSYAFPIEDVQNAMTEVVHNAHPKAGSSEEKCVTALRNAVMNPGSAGRLSPEVQQFAVKQIINHMLEM